MDFDGFQPILGEIFGSSHFLCRCSPAWSSWMLPRSDQPKKCRASDGSIWGCLHCSGKTVIFIGGNRHFDCLWHFIPIHVSAGFWVSPTFGQSQSRVSRCSVFDVFTMFTIFTYVAFGPFWGHMKNELLWSLFHAASGHLQRSSCQVLQKSQEPRERTFRNAKESIRDKEGTKCFSMIC